MKSKLNKKQIDMLWSGGGKGPYSQAKLIKEVRILDDKVSRVFLVVEVEINPTTFKSVEKYRNNEEFKNNIAIQQLLDHSDYRGPKFGYVSMAFKEEYTDEKILIEAELALQRSQSTIIKMHQFIMNNFYTQIIQKDIS